MRSVMNFEPMRTRAEIICEANRSCLIKPLSVSSQPQTECPAYHEVSPTAEPVSPPQKTADGSYVCIIEWQRTAYTITWLGSPQYPDLTAFPGVGNAVIRPLQQSPALVTLWTNSMLVDYGAHAVIRSTSDRCFPITKLAHPDKQSVSLLQHEFNLLIALSKLNATVVEVDSTPILDNGVICGYRMKQLQKLDASELVSRRPDIKAAVEDLHSKGYCHGDITASNIMKDEEGRITFIDLSFGGQLNERIPSVVPAWVHDGSHFKLDTDYKALSRL